MSQNPMLALIAKIGLIPASLVLGKQSDLQVSQLHGDNYSLAYGGFMFTGASPSGVTTSAGLAATYVGLCLSNPAGNTKNLALRRIAAAFIAAESVVTGFNLITGYAVGGITAHTTPLVPFSSLIGTGPAPTAKLDSACTLVGTPVYTLPIGETATATTLPFASIDLEGGLILPPGAYCAIGTTIAGPASGFQGAMQWEEIAI